MREITKRQKEVLEIIERFTAEKGYPPSYRELTKILNLASAAGVHKHIKALVKKGYLTKEDFLSRSLRIKDKARGQDIASGFEMVELPLVGFVAAGEPIEAIEQRNETMSIPAAQLKQPARKHFILQVRGDSMIEESILNGDYVIVEERETARNGEVVVALVDGHDATLKRFYWEKDRVRLQPANARMEPIFVDGNKLRIQGVVKGVWRKY